MKICLRPARDADRPFLYDLHCATMREVIERTWGWDERWQHSDFKRRFDECAVSIVDRDRQTAGCVWLEGRPDSIYVSNLQVLPHLQRRGVGTAILRALFEQAAERRMAVTLAVLQGNPDARRLYERLGFRETGVEGPFVRMRYGAAVPETLEQRLRRVVGEEVALVDYDPIWAEWFRREKAHLLRCLPGDLVGRIEHFGSTAVPGLAAKPVVDLLVEITDLEVGKSRIVPVLESQGYEYFWRPTHGADGPPFYAWFIKRDPATGRRTHHIHMVEAQYVEHWDRVCFRDYLIGHGDVAEQYAALKRQLAAAHPNDRVAYTQGKTSFINAVMQRVAQKD